mmetsp:Transcript_63572/g.150629  ORF Transcript_63572/g.150629 Transcript_63572/m.150629 type:complete len:250 (-) Transcript_63572:64-813(-)
MENDRLWDINGRPTSRIYWHAQNMGFDLPSVLRIAPGVDMGRFTTRVDRGNRHRDHVVVGRVSRLVPEKDPTTFVRAAALIAEWRDDVHFAIWGDGEEAHSLKRLAQDLGLSPDRLTFHGATNDVRSALEDMDIFAYSTVGDSVGWVLLEAMAMELPIVSTDIDAIPTFVRHNDNGLLVDPRDVEAFASAVMYMVDDRDTRLAMGKRSRERCEGEFQLERYVRDYVELYRHVGNTRYVPKQRHLMDWKG